MAAVVLAVAGCGGGTIESVTPGFASSSTDVCDTRTSSVGLVTSTGGRLALELRDVCGRSAGSCRSVDVYAANAHGSVRIAGGSIFLDDCTIPATPGQTLVATFTPGDSSMPAERFVLSLTGTCRADGGTADGGRPDAGTGVCPPDAGASRSDASIVPVDAGLAPRDAGAGG